MNSTTAPSDPALPADRTVAGVLVHPLALFTAFVGPAIVYAVSDDEFTRENARQALNWHVTVIALATVAATTVLLGADGVTVGGAGADLGVLPSPIDTVFAAIGLVLLFATIIAVFATFAYAVIATLQAISGSVWRYPGAINVADRFL